MSTILKIVQVEIEGRRISALKHLKGGRIRSDLLRRLVRTTTYIISFLLEPIKRLLRTVGAVAGYSVRLAIGGVRTAAAGDLCLRERHVRRGPGDVAAEPVHVV